MTNLILLRRKITLINWPLFVAFSIAQLCSVFHTLIAMSFLKRQVNTMYPPPASFRCRLCVSESVFYMTLEVKYLPADMKLF